MRAEYESVALTGRHDVARFDCGVSSLAVHTDLRGLGYGAQILMDAPSRAARAAEAGGGRIAVVDALDDAAVSFYQHYDFTPVKGNPRRLALKMVNVRKLLG